jgi:uncharacterized protein (TIGR02246 family)
MNRTTDSGSEIPAITHVVATLEHAQRNELVEEFVSLFREDAIWTTGAGKLLIGRDAIAAFTQKVLPGAMKGLVPSYEVVHVLFIRPDVAAVKVRQRYFSPEGELVTELGEGTPMYVMSKENGQWRLTANQNTGVAAEDRVMYPVILTDGEMTS